MKKFRLIPFRWLPSSWGLSGPLLEEQEARYYYEGQELEEKLSEIYLEGDELQSSLLEIQRRYNTISEADYQLALAKMISDEVEREVAILTTQAASGEISELEAEKAIATLRGEPWIKIINDGLDMEQGVDGYYFEFDWNDLWVAALREAGYVGPTEESIVQAWFQEVCRMEASASMGTPPINGGIVFG